MCVRVWNVMSAQVNGDGGTAFLPKAKTPWTVTTVMLLPRLLSFIGPVHQLTKHKNCELS